MTVNKGVCDIPTHRKNENILKIAQLMPLKL